MKIVNFSKMVIVMSVFLLFNKITSAQVSLADIQGVWDIVSVSCYDSEGNIDIICSEEYNDDYVVKRNLSYEFIDSSFYINLDATLMRATTFTLGSIGEVQYDPQDHQDLVDIVGGLKITSVTNGVMECSINAPDEGDTHTAIITLQLRE